jgi:hypothetical protein
MRKRTDIAIVREFIEDELCRRGDTYIGEARSALAAFDRMAAELDRLRREKEVRDFDEIWPGHA